MLSTRLGRAQHPSVTPARFMTMHDPGEVTAPGWWQVQSLQLASPLHGPWSSSNATASAQRGRFKTGRVVRGHVLDPGSWRRKAHPGARAGLPGHPAAFLRGSRRGQQLLLQAGAGSNAGRETGSALLCYLLTKHFRSPGAMFPALLSSKNWEFWKPRASQGHQALQKNSTP